MLKKRAGRKFSRNTNSRKAMFRSLVRNLVLSGSITTTEAKAKTVSRLMDRILKKAKTDTLSSKRSIIATIGNDKELFKKIFEYKTLIASRNSGFTKRTRLNTRRGDNAPMVKFELVMPKDEIKSSSRTAKRDLGSKK